MMATISFVSYIYNIMRHQSITNSISICSQLTANWATMAIGTMHIGVSSALPGEKDIVHSAKLCKMEC